MRTLKNFFCLYLLAFVIFINYSPAGAQIDPDVKNITGKIQKYQSNKDSASNAYEIVTAGKEHYKIIGPKSIVDQLIAEDNSKLLETFEVILTGKVIKKDNKQGIVINSFQILDNSTKKAESPAGSSDTGEISISPNTQEILMPKEKK